MSSRTRPAALSEPRSALMASGASDGWMGRRVVLVMVLTPALILFMSRKDVDHVDHAASRPRVAPHVFEQWPSSGFRAIDRSGYRIALSTLARNGSISDSRGAELIYARALFLAGRYDNRPYWNRAKLKVGVPIDRATADLAIEHLIPCESMGQSINRMDDNGKISYGILQFQDWDEWAAASGLGGDPDNREDAIRMAEWAIENGMINHWTCAQILNMM